MWNAGDTMKCEICKINEATRAVVRNVDGEDKELFICNSCMRTAPAAGSIPTSLTDILFSLGMQSEPGEAIEDAVCPSCGMSRGDVREKRRLGCPKCYDIFQTDIRTFMSGQQPATQARPEKGAPDAREIEQLKRELDKAVAEERYEDAGDIMIKIRELSGGSGEGKKESEGVDG